MAEVDYNFDDYSELHSQYVNALSLCEFTSFHPSDLSKKLASAIDYCAIVKAELSFEMISSFFDHDFVDYCNEMLSLVHNSIVSHDTVVLYYYAKMHLLICRTASMFELLLQPTHKFNAYVQICQLDMQNDHDDFIKLVRFSQHVCNDDASKAAYEISMLTDSVNDILLPTVSRTHVFSSDCMLMQMPYCYIKNAQFPNMLRYCITDHKLYVKNNVLDTNVMRQVLRKLDLVAIGRHHSALVDMNCTLYSFAALQALQTDVAVLCYDVHKYDSHLYYTKCAKIVNDKSIERQLDDFNSIMPSMIRVVKTSDIHLLDQMN